MMTTPMRDDFCVFILTNGRPYKQLTYELLRRRRYTGKLFIVIDDEDDTSEEYRKIYSDKILVFSKDKVARFTDQYDNFTDRRTPLWARNACWDLANQVECRYFIQLDDDYSGFNYRTIGRGHSKSKSRAVEYHNWKIKNIEPVFEAMVKLVDTVPIKSIAMSQGGDHIGGSPARKRFKRKAMNSFVCDTMKPFLFRGRLNDDVNTYVSLGNIGDLFFTDMSISLTQANTQSSPGGITETYLDSGTYVKSFYTVMAAPSCTSVGVMGGGGKTIDMRLHHQINWRKAAPKIISEQPVAGI